MSILPTIAVTIPMSDDQFSSLPFPGSPDGVGDGRAVVVDVGAEVRVDEGRNMVQVVGTPPMAGSW